MFISTTSELLRALQIATKHHRCGYEVIKITIIDVKKAMTSHHDISNAGDIARHLKRDNATLLNSEWVFLGRVASSAIVHHIEFNEELYRSLITSFPSFNFDFNLTNLRSSIAQDINAYLRDQQHKAREFGRSCAMLAQSLGPWTCDSEIDVYLLFVEAIRSWKQETFEWSNADEQAFCSIVDLYASSIFRCL